jgi:hypothetical protein
MAFTGPYPTKFSGTASEMLISATTFSGGVTNAGTIGAGGVIVTSSTFQSGGFLNSKLISAGLIGIGVFADSTVNGAIVNKGTIIAFNSVAFCAGILVSRGVVSGGIAVGSAGAVLASGVPILVESAPLFAGGISNSGTIFAGFHGAADIAVVGVSTFSGGITNSKGGLLRNLRTGTFGGIYVDAVTSFSGGVRNAGTISVGGTFGVGIFGNTQFADVPMTFSGGVTNTGKIAAALVGVEIVGVSTFSGGVANSHGGVISAAFGIGIRGATQFPSAVATFLGGVVNNGVLATTSKGILVSKVAVFSGGSGGGIVNGGTISAPVFGVDITGVSTFSGRIANSHGGVISAPTGIVVTNVAVFNAGTSGGIINSGTIVAEGFAGIVVGFGVGTFFGEISNAGTISTPSFGMAIIEASIFSGGVSNRGKMAVEDRGIVVGNVSNFFGDINNSGTISATFFSDIVVSGGNFSGGIANSGSLTGQVGIFAGTLLGIPRVLTFLGGITNRGRIAGGDDGILIERYSVFSGSIGNSGVISANFQGGIDVLGVDTYVGSIVNSTGGKIVAAVNEGIGVGGISSFIGGITNGGTISAARTGIGLASIFTVVGSVSNRGTIKAVSAGIALGVPGLGDPVGTFVGDIINSGTVTAGTGIGIFDGTIISGAIVDSGTILASRAGVLIDSSSEILASTIHI